MRFLCVHHQGVKICIFSSTVVRQMGQLVTSCSQYMQSERCLHGRQTRFARLSKHMTHAACFESSTCDCWSVSSRPCNATFSLYSSSFNNIKASSCWRKLVISMSPLSANCKPCRNCSCRMNLPCSRSCTRASRISTFFSRRRFSVRRYSEFVFR